MAKKHQKRNRNILIGVGVMALLVLIFYLAVSQTIYEPSNIITITPYEQVYVFEIPPDTPTKELTTLKIYASTTTGGNGYVEFDIFNYETNSYDDLPCGEVVRKDGYKLCENGRQFDNAPPSKPEQGGEWLITLENPREYSLEGIIKIYVNKNPHEGISKINELTVEPIYTENSGNESSGGNGGNESSGGNGGNESSGGNGGTSGGTSGGTGGLSFLGIAVLSVISLLLILVVYGIIKRRRKRR